MTRSQKSAYNDGIDIKTNVGRVYLITKLLQKQISKTIYDIYDNIEHFFERFFPESAARLDEDEFSVFVSIGAEYIYVQLCWFDEEEGAAMVYDNTVNFDEFNDWYGDNYE